MTTIYSYGDQLFTEIKKIYETNGDEKYMIDEDITQLEHALQAAYIAYEDGASYDLIIGMLLHDIGQILHKNLLGNVDILHKQHADIGYFYLKSKGLPNYVCNIVKYHTLSKVVLCGSKYHPALEPNYFDKLSYASKESYVHQRELFTEEDITDFFSHPNKDDFIRARKYDDAAKIEDMVVPEFEAYRDMFISIMKKDV